MTRFWLRFGKGVVKTKAFLINYHNYFHYMQICGECANSQWRVRFAAVVAVVAPGTSRG